MQLYLNGLEHNREAEAQEKDAVGKGSEDFGPGEPKSALGPRPPRETDCDKSYDESRHVRQHVKWVRHLWKQ